MEAGWHVRAIGRAVPVWVPRASTEGEQAPSPTQVVIEYSRTPVERRPSSLSHHRLVYSILARCVLCYCTGRVCLLFIALIFVTTSLIFVTTRPLHELTPRVSHISHAHTMLLTTGGTAAFSAVLKDFAPQAAGLFGNMRVPAALVAGARLIAYIIQLRTHAAHAHAPMVYSLERIGSYDSLFSVAFAATQGLVAARTLRLPALLYLSHTPLQGAALPMGFFAGPKIAPDDRPRLKTLKTLHALLGMLTLCA